MQSMRSIYSRIQYPKCVLFVPIPKFEVYFTTEALVALMAIDRCHPFTGERYDGTFYS